VVHGVLVGRLGVASLTRRRGDLAPEAQKSEEEESNPVRAFAKLGRLGLMTVRDENPACCGPHAHTSDTNGDWTGLRETNWLPSHKA
jgi:hypothetical protein